MIYNPPTGTIPFRAIAWLKAMAGQGQHGPFSSAGLCEGIDSDPAGFVTCMKPALTAGIVTAVKLKGRGKTLWWALGDGKTQHPHDFTPDVSMAPKPRVTVRPGPLFPGVNASRYDDGQPFRAVEFYGRVIVTGVQIIDGAAVFTREQFRALQGATA